MASWMADCGQEACFSFPRTKKNKRTKNKSGDPHSGALLPKQNLKYLMILLIIVDARLQNA